MIALFDRFRDGSRGQNDHARDHPVRRQYGIALVLYQVACNRETKRFRRMIRPLLH
jgi:hypothetical protein